MYDSLKYDSYSLDIHITGLFSKPYAINRTPTANKQMHQNINTPLFTLSIDLFSMGIQTLVANTALHYLLWNYSYSVRFSNSKQNSPQPFSKTLTAGRSKHCSMTGMPTYPHKGKSNTKTNSREKRSSNKIHVNPSHNLEMEWSSSHLSVFTLEGRGKAISDINNTTLNNIWNSSKNLVYTQKS